MAAGKLRSVAAYLIAVLVAAALGSIVQTQFNMAAIAGLGVEVPATTRLAVTLEDLGRFAPLYAAIVAVALLVGFAVAGLLARRASGWRRPLFILAGGLAIAAALALMNAVLPVTAIAASRFASGYLALALAGAAGGWAYLAARGR